MENRTTIQVSEELRKKLRVIAARRDISYQELLSDMISVFDELEKDKTIISIPAKLSETTKEKIKDTDFRNVSEYVTFILRLLLYEKAEISMEKNTEKIKNRLKKLGYF
jgi:Arc/MetJ-type ribon-helix-helix transcriptional regulator